MVKGTDAQRGSSASLGVPYPSKVSLPARRPAIVKRDRLTAALEKGAEGRITVISAPAGYGKTTLLLDYAQESKDPVCWYGLDERDCDLDTFLRYLIAAGRQEFPNFAEELERVLDSGEDPSPEQLVDLLVEATESVPRRVVFVLDDFHFLDSISDTFQEVLNGWLYRLPYECHVVLSGRTQPQLGLLPLMSARQEVEWIIAKDFSFTCEEVAQLFRDVLGQEIALDDAQHLADLTEGWAAALVLMADKVEMARTSISLEQLRRSDTLFQYMSLEQFDPLPEDIQEFLLGSAIGRTLAEPVINELLGIKDAEDKLHYLERRNLFVVREKGGFRYHRLFRAFLISRFRTLDPERFIDLSRHSAELHENASRWEDAVYQYMQVGDWGKVVEITERVGWRLFEEGRWETLAEWLDAVPAVELESQPKLVLWKARVLHYVNQIDRSLSLVAGAIEAFHEREEWIPLAEALVTKGMCLRVKGDYEDSKQELEKARGLLVEHDGPVALLTEARKELGFTLGMSGDFSSALIELRGAFDVYDAQGDVHNIAEVSENLGNALMALGRLSDAAPYLERAKQRWARIGNEGRLVRTLNNLGMLYYLLGDYEQAESVFRQALAIAETRPSSKAESYLLACLADIRRDQGQLDDALEMYKSALDASDELDEAYIRIYTMGAIANTHRMKGDIAAAHSWAGRTNAEAEERGGVFEKGLCRMTTGLIERDQGDLKGAVTALEEAIELLEKASATRELASANLYLAGAYFSLKKKRVALELLERAATLVSELGYDHFLLVEARRNPLLIQYAGANKVADGYFAKVLTLMTGTDGESDPGSDAAFGGPVANVQGFGKPTVEFSGREITDLEWRSEKSKEMFFFFLCSRRPLRKDEIVAALWPDLPDDKTTSVFHSNMYRLRKALYSDCIAKDSGRYVLDPQGRFVFDVEEFQQALEKADGLEPGDDNRISLMEKALKLYRGQFAPDFFSEWAENLRWQTDEQYMSLLATLTSAYTEAKEYKKSADLCQRILELDEFNEAAWQRLMTNYVLSDQIEAAKYSYNRYVQIISEGIDGDVPDFEDVRREIVAVKLKK
jgi:ATP/maltotriose-dependent transcriptional regulator MalT/DNA-binding SARP family transcriptional activator